MPAGGSNSRSPDARRITIPLVLLLLAVVAALVAAVAGAVIVTNYRRSTAVAADVGRQQFDGLRTEIALQQQQLLQPLEFAVGVLARDPALGRGRPDDLEEVFFAVLDANPQITELRVAYDDGAVFALVNLASVSRLRAAIGAPDEARFARRRVFHGSSGRTLTWTYLDAEHATLGDFSIDLPMPIAGEKWLSDAEAAHGAVVQTMAGLIPSLRTAGVTFAAAFEGPAPGVIATDVSLGQLSPMLAALKSSDDDQIFIFDQDDTLLATPDIDPVMESDAGLSLGAVSILASPVARAMVEKFHRDGPFALAALDVADARYLTSIIRIGNDDDRRPPMYLGLALPDVTFTGSVLAASRDGVVISLLILAAAAPLVVLVARWLARPLTRLQRVTDGIARLDMSQAVDTPTRIREIAGLARSIGQMKNALGEMAKFVPKSLVQDLLRSGMALAVGGERRELTLMFSDVRGFTPLVETAAPDALMAQMSRYFDAVGGAILAHRGTIDKYIGDAVFAFWNAPVRASDHCSLACAAVLAASAAAEALNAEWEADGLPQWPTCFSLHLGEAVVGNVGSRDRLEYTAIGSAVNMAARLEGLNKFYGTTILASAAVVTKTGNAFRFRPVDLVVPKGAAQPLTIYELLGVARDDDNASRSAWEKFYATYTARDWRKAYSLIVDITDAQPDDLLAELYRNRVSAFLAAPPSPSWDGATRFDSK